MAGRPQNKYLNPTLGQQALGIVPLGTGEISRLVRVRGPEEAVNWFATLTPEKRTEALLLAYAQRPGAEPK